MYENYYYEQLAKISTCVKYSIDAYHKYILPRYILLFYFGNVNSRDFIKLIPSMLCFPGFLTVSYRFPSCFRMFLPVFLRFPSVFLLFPLFPTIDFESIYPSVISDIVDIEQKLVRDWLRAIVAIQLSFFDKAKNLAKYSRVKRRDRQTETFNEVIFSYNGTICYRVY